MDELQAKVARAVEEMRGEIVALTQDLVRIRSVTPTFPGVVYEQEVEGERRVNERLKQEYDRAGLQSDLWETAPGRANLVGVWRGSRGGRSLICNGHIDTVPPIEADRWADGSPWSGAVRDGRIWGLGATDMKSGVVAQFMATEALRRCGVRLKGDVILQSVVGEEMMEHRLGTTAAVERGYRADAAVVTEPTGVRWPLQIATCSPSTFYFRVTVEGKATHCGARAQVIRPGGGGPAVGANAVEKLMLVVQGLLQLEQEWGISKRHPLFPPGFFTIHPGLFRGDSGFPAPFMFAAHAHAEFIAWFPPQEDPEVVRAEIERHVATVCQTDPWLREHPAEFEWKNHWPPYHTPTDHPISQAMLRAHEAANGTLPREQPYFVGFEAANDGTFLEDAGIPSIAFGPGNLMLAHHRDEYVEIGELVGATKALAFLMMDWCGVEEA